MTVPGALVYVPREPDVLPALNQPDGTVLQAGQNYTCECGHNWEVVWANVCGGQPNPTWVMQSPAVDTATGPFSP